MRTLIILAMAFVLMAGCAHVPKESVELSATVGRDIATVHKSHIELARLLFQQMRADVNRFVDDVYAPAQIRAVMERQWALARSTNEDDQNKSILLAINDAMLPGADPALQADVLGAMGDMVSHIHADVESMRQELLGRLDGQEDTVIASIDRAYQQIHYGNSIVTGYLSSVVQVTDAQAEMLATVGIDRDLPQVIGTQLAHASGRINRLVGEAEKADAKLEQAKHTAEELRHALENLTSEGGDGTKEDK